MTLDEITKSVKSILDTYNASEQVKVQALKALQEGFRYVDRAESSNKPTADLAYPF